MQRRLCSAVQCSAEVVKVAMAVAVAVGGRVGQARGSRSRDRDRDRVVEMVTVRGAVVWEMR